RVPFETDSLTFSASWAQQVTSKNWGSPSSHSLVCGLRRRLLTATPNSASARPVLVKRSSGSRGTLPMMVTELSLAMFSVPLPVRRSARRRLTQQTTLRGFAVGQTDGLVADDVVRETEEAIDRVEVGGLGADLQHGVDALELLVDRVRVAAPAPQ